MPVTQSKNNPNNLVNVDAATLAAQIANWAAQMEFSKARFQALELPQFQVQTGISQQELQLAIDKFAFERAEAVHSRALQEAALTGTYEGKPTLEWLTQQAALTGVLADGSQTIQGKLSEAQMAQMRHAMELESQQYQLELDKFGTNTAQWQQTFAAGQQSDLRNHLLSEAGLTGTYNGQQTLASQTLAQQGTQEAARLAFEREALARNLQEQAAQRQQTGALGYLNLLASTQNNPFKMLRVQQNAGDFNTVAANMLGQIQMPGAATIQNNPGGIQGVSDLFVQYTPNGQAVYPAGTGPVTVGAPYSWPQAGAAGANAPTLDPVTGQPVMNTAYTYSPPGVQAPVGDYNYEPTPSGQTQVYPPGVTAPYTGPQYSTTTPQSQAQQGVLGAEGTTASQDSGVLTPNKISGENYQNANAGMKNLTWQYLVDAGWDEESAKDIFSKSLPRYGGPAQGKVVRAA